LVEGGGRLHARPARRLPRRRCGDLENRDLTNHLDLGRKPPLHEGGRGDRRGEGHYGQINRRIFIITPPPLRAEAKRQPAKCKSSPGPAGGPRPRDESGKGKGEKGRGP